MSQMTVGKKTSAIGRQIDRDIRAFSLKEVIQKGSKKRIQTRIGEVDRVLGGGLVGGMAVLIAGEPGIGKSTLVLQIASSVLNAYSKKNEKLPVFYIAGEESCEQIGDRAERLGSSQDDVKILEETDVDQILSWLDKNISPNALIIVDSVQTLTTQDFPSVAGSVVQVRECAFRLISFAKNRKLPLILIGHVTKEGAIAGPRVLEHMVDTVVWFEGERGQALRVLRAIKNRFGPTDEIGIFAMTEKGLKELPNPSEIFLEDIKNVPGSAVTVILEGTRPLLVEVQALVARTKLAFPKRVAVGIASRRLEILSAVLARRAGIPLWNYDCFVNVVGATQVSEPAADLAICLSIVSSFFDKPLPQGSVVVGEVGLLGEVRGVASLEKRILEGKRLGFNKPITYKEADNIRQMIKKYFSSKT